MICITLVRDIHAACNVHLQGQLFLKNQINLQMRQLKKSLAARMLIKPATLILPQRHISSVEISRLIAIPSSTLIAYIANNNIQLFM